MIPLMPVGMGVMGAIGVQMGVMGAIDVQQAPNPVKAMLNLEKRLVGTICQSSCLSLSEPVKKTCTAQRDRGQKPPTAWDTTC